MEKTFEVIAGMPSCITLYTTATMKDLADLFRKLADEIYLYKDHVHLDQPVYKCDWFYPGLNIRVRCDERLL